MKIEYDDLANLILEGSDETDISKVKFLLKLEGESTTTGVRYKLTEDGLYQIENGKDKLSNITFNQFLNAEIIIIPYLPRFNEKYWTITKSSDSAYSIEAIERTWQDEVYDYLLLEAGLVFKTKNLAYTNGGEKFKEIKYRWK